MDVKNMKTEDSQDVKGLLQLKIELQKETSSLDLFLNQLLIPNKDKNNITLPFTIQELHRAVSEKGEQYISSLLKKKAAAHKEIEDLLGEISTMLDNEESDNEAYKTIYKNQWILPCLQNESTSIWLKLSKYQNLILEASCHSQKVSHHLAAEHEDFSLLFCPKEKLLEKYINCLDECKSCGTVRFLLLTLDKVTIERKELLEKLEEVSKGIVSDLIYGKDKSDISKLSEEENVGNLITKNIERQKEIMKCLQVEYSKFLEEKNDLKFTMRFVTEFEKFSELSQKLEEETNFYLTLQPTVKTLKEEVMALCNKRKNEKESLAKLLTVKEDNTLDKLNDVPLLQTKRFKLEITNLQQLKPKVDPYWLDTKMKCFGSTEKVNAPPTVSYMFTDEAAAKEAYNYLNTANSFCGFCCLSTEEYSTL